MSKSKLSATTIGGVKLHDYAIQGNAILGIKESGKSYTATFMAESLLDAGVPIVAFDPIGVWRFLKVGRKGPGFAVIVAGAESATSDVELTAQSAPLIVQAAMRENIPLVLDLYSMKFSKADWKRIVQSSLEVLLYENKDHGLRHVFIEEAAEFCPQRVGPDSGRVYAEVEKLARMGGNASLGYTLISQRAEEVNKAVLELCDGLYLHRQKGRHSLTALGKWMDVADVGASKEIIKSLPKLEQGECWVWPQGSQEPVRINVPEKKTVHPDRRNPAATLKGVSADVDSFVSRLHRELAKAKPAAKVEAHPKGRTSKREEGVPETMDHHTAELEGRISRLEQEVHMYRRKASDAEGRLAKVKKALQPQYEAMAGLFQELSAGDAGASSTDWSPWLGKLTGGARRMLEVLIDKRSLTKQQLAFQAELTAGTGTFTTYLGQLNTLGIIRKEGDRIVLNDLS